VKEGKLYLNAGGASRLRLVPPISERVVLCEIEHETAGHCAIGKLKELVERKYYWKGIFKSCLIAISRCLPCIKAKAKHAF
jgi:Integrase zinc binding domain